MVLLIERLIARHCALGDCLVAALDLDHALLEQLAEDAGGVEPLEAADRVQVVEGDFAVDLREDEAGPRIEVQPDDLVRGNGGARARVHRPDLALVHEGQVLLAHLVELERVLVVRLPRRPSPETSRRGCAPAPSGGIPAPAGWSARAGRLLPTPSPHRACGPCGSGPAPREGAPRTGLRRPGWPSRPPLGCAPTRPSGLATCVRGALAIRPAPRSRAGRAGGGRPTAPPARAAAAPVRGRCARRA